MTSKTVPICAARGLSSRIRRTVEDKTRRLVIEGPAPEQLLLVLTERETRVCVAVESAIPAQCKGYATKLDCGALSRKEYAVLDCY